VPAVRLRQFYVTSGLGLTYFDRLIFVAQSVHIAYGTRLTGQTLYSVMYEQPENSILEYIVTMGTTERKHFLDMLLI
jgi:hypothetical protein